MSYNAAWGLGVLVIRGHATGTDFHAVILSLVYDARNPVFLQV
jgi:hypothetical protein